MNENSRLKSWVWGGIAGLAFVSAVVVLVVVNLNKRVADESQLSVGEHKPSSIIPSSFRTDSESLVQTVQEYVPLPALDFPPGSVEEACGLNEYVPYHYRDPDVRNPWPKSPYNAKGELVALQESQECMDALEAHISDINPYLWGERESKQNLQFAFVVLDEPLTFGRIFSDPMGDFHRVQEALSNPECLLKGDETNWELKETCHADAFLNYALINRFCFKVVNGNTGVRNRDRKYYWPEDNPTPEQDRFMWKQSLESAWVEHKCETLDPSLHLMEHQSFYQLVKTFGDPADMYPQAKWDEYLINLAARLGDDAAGLTKRTSLYNYSYEEQGEKFGRYADLLASDQWREFVDKEPPSVDRFLQVFHMLAIAGARRADRRDEIEFDWEVVAQQLCVPPYPWSEIELASLESDESFADDLLAFREKYENPKSCQEVVHEIRQRNIQFRPLLDVLDKLEQVALELEVYD